MNFRHLYRLEKQRIDPHKAEQERRAKEAKEARELLELELELYELERQEAFEARQKRDRDARQLEEEMRNALGLTTGSEVTEAPLPVEVPEVLEARALLAVPKAKGKWKTEEQIKAKVAPPVKPVRKVRGAGEHREVVVIPTPEPTKPAPKLSAYKPARVTVRIGVQKGGVGPVQSYTYVHHGLVSVEIARMEACKAAKKEGLHFCWYIEEIVET